MNDNLIIIISINIMNDYYFEKIKKDIKEIWNIVNLIFKGFLKLVFFVDWLKGIGIGRNG